jgi:hypothetical protein
MSNKTADTITLGIAITLMGGTLVIDFMIGGFTHWMFDLLVGCC